MVVNSPPSATFFDINEKSLAHQRNLTAPSAAQNSRERQQGMGIWHMTSVRNSDDHQKENERLDRVTETIIMFQQSQLLTVSNGACPV